MKKRAGRVRLLKRDWVVCRTETRREVWALQNAEQQGYECYLPKIEELHKGMKRIVPLFPGYLFVRMKHGRWASLTGTYGVIDLVYAGQSVAMLDNHFIEALKTITTDNGYIPLPAQTENERFQPGSEVRLRSGPFMGYIGIYEGQKSSERAQVLLSILGGDTPVEIDPAQLEPADANKR